MIAEDLARAALLSPETGRVFEQGADLGAAGACEARSGNSSDLDARLPSNAPEA